MTSPLAVALPKVVRQGDGAEEKGVETRIVDPLQGSSWDTSLDRYPSATTFHTSAWARVLARSYDHRPTYLDFSRGGETIALLPLMEVRSIFTGCRAVSLPFSDFCDLLLSDQSMTRAITEKLRELMLARRWKHVELRGGRETFFPGANRAASFYVHKLSLLHSMNDLWMRLASPVRRAIRKAERSGVSVQMSTTRPVLSEFYQLHCRTRRRHGLPPQPFRFFRNIYEEIIAPERGFMVLARNHSRTIAAAMFFEFNGSAIYKFGASDDSLQELRPNNLVMWEAIRLLAQRGCRTLHFGRTELENEGLRRFKRGWGAIEEVIQYFRLSTTVSAPKQSKESAGAFYNAVFRRMPLPINGLAGALIYPHLD